MFFALGHEAQAFPFLPPFCKLYFTNSFDTWKKLLNIAELIFIYYDHKTINDFFKDNVDDVSCATRCRLNDPTSCFQNTSYKGCFTPCCTWRNDGGGKDYSSPRPISLYCWVFKESSSDNTHIKNKSMYFKIQQKLADLLVLVVETHNNHLREMDGCRMPEWRLIFSLCSSTSPLRAIHAAASATIRCRSHTNARHAIKILIAWFVFSGCETATRHSYLHFYDDAKKIQDQKI